MVIFKSLLIEFQRYYPELLDTCYVVNTPMFFQDIYDFEIKPIISKETAAKIIITGEQTHKSLQDKVDVDKLPRLYGGSCECDATCVYSDKGPWADVENKINFQNRYMTEIGGALGGGAMEEFKLQEDDDDQIDLLGEKGGLEALKNALRQGEFQGFDMDGDDLHKIKNNTVIDGGDGDAQYLKEEMLKNMLQKNMINLPGQTPMNTQIDEE